ncbi:MAG TPA: ABC transporter permease [Actinomycetota bacterium]|nr:ABC transporter permease [Actinomycetota bacterium]
MSRVLGQYLALTRRSLFNTLRTPIAIFPIIGFPLLLLSMTSAAMERSTSLPGFPPVDSFLQFMVATTVIQGAMFGAIAGGAGIASDIEGGFFERLIATPVSRTAIIIGRVASVATMAFFQALVFIGVTVIFGMRPEGGVIGTLMVAAIAALTAAGIGSIAVAFGLRTGSTEAVQGSFPLLFAGLFMSSAFFPRTLMTGWFKTVADWNPLSYLIENTRSQIIFGVSWGDFFTALGIAAGILVVGTLFANLALRGRLAEGA